MSERARPNRPTPRQGATETNPQPEAAGRAGRTDQHAPTATGQQQLGPQLGQTGAGAAGEHQTAANAAGGGNVVSLNDVLTLATWVAYPTDDEGEQTYRREQVRGILYSIIDQMFPG